jgi:orotate phosphoribosyltransferase
VRESLSLISAAGARAVGVAIALDRQERATEGGQDVPYSAVQYVSEQLHLGVAAIATLEDLLHYLHQARDPALQAHAAPVAAYRDRYGV